MNNKDIELRKQDYIGNGGSRCFHCGSEDLTTDSKKELDDSGITASVSCDNCHEEWEELYKLSCIIE